MVLNWDFILKVIVNDIKDTADPEWVTWIDKFICTTIKTTKLHLTMWKPVHKTRNIKILQPSHNSKSSHTTKGESTMSLTSNNVWNSTFRRLRGQNILGNALKNIFIQTQKLHNNGNNIWSSEITFSMLMHHEFPSFFDFFKECIKPFFI